MGSPRSQAPTRTAPPGRRAMTRSPRQSPRHRRPRASPVPGSTNRGRALERRDDLRRAHGRDGGRDARRHGRRGRADRRSRGLAAGLRRGALGHRDAARARFATYKNLSRAGFQRFADAGLDERRGERDGGGWATWRCPPATRRWSDRDRRRRRREGPRSPRNPVVARRRTRAGRVAPDHGGRRRRGDRESRRDFPTCRSVAPSRAPAHHEPPRGRSAGPGSRRCSPTADGEPPARLSGFPRPSICRINAFGQALPGATPALGGGPRSAHRADARSGDRHAGARRLGGARRGRPAAPVAGRLLARCPSLAPAAAVRRSAVGSAGWSVVCRALRAWPGCSRPSSAPAACSRPLPRRPVTPTGAPGLGAGVTCARERRLALHLGSCFARRCGTGR